MARAPWLLLLLAVGWPCWRYAPPEQGRLLFGGLHAVDLGIALLLLWLASLVWLRSVSRTMAARWLLATVTALGSWAAAEALYWAWPRPSQPWLGAFPQPHFLAHGEVLPDISHAWGVPGEPVPYSFTTNAWGYRNPPELTDADVFCVGDSMVLAIAQPWPQTLPCYLQQAIGRKVGNVSLIDKAPQDLQRRFRALQLPLRGKLVLQFLCEENDLADSLHYEQAGLAQQPLAQALIPARRSLTKQLLLTLQRWTQPQVAEAAWAQAQFAGQRHYFYYHAETTPARAAQAARIHAELLAFAQHIAANGGQFGVVLVPARLRVLAPLLQLPSDHPLARRAKQNDPWPSELAQYCAQQQLPYRDGTLALRQLAQTGVSPFLPNDTHLSAAGLAALAEDLLAWEWLAQRVAK